MGTRAERGEQAGSAPRAGARRRAPAWLPTALAAAIVLGGCDTLGYYLQAINGHAQILHSTRPIAALLADPSTPAAERRRLRSVLEMRDFAVHELALPDNGSYRGFASIGRDTVLWVVVAAPEFSVQPLQWCYPVVGCAAYRGYFDRAAARAEAQRLAGQGRDTSVAPVAAYSTLGWLPDPVTSSVLYWPPPLLAGLLFHELAHQRLYLSGDSGFNEAFATAVERTGVERWLRRRGDWAELAEWQQRLALERRRVRLLLAGRERLRALYGQPLAPADMRRRKREELERLRTQLADLTGGATANGRDPGRERPLNNAGLALVGTYEQWVPAFLELLRRTHENFPAFYRAAEALAALPAEPRRECLEALLEGARNQTERRSRGE
jgi:predicted aminopeptidase